MPHPPSLPRYKTLSKCPSRCPSGKTPSREPPIHVPLPGHIWISNGVLPGRMDGRHIWISNGVLPGRMDGRHIWISNGVLPGRMDGRHIWISNGVLPRHIHMDGVLPGHVDGGFLGWGFAWVHGWQAHMDIQWGFPSRVFHPRAQAKPHPYVCAEAKPHWISICACHPCAQAKPHWISICAQAGARGWGVSGMGFCLMGIWMGSTSTALYSTHINKMQPQRISTFEITCCVNLTVCFDSALSVSKAGYKIKLQLYLVGCHVHVKRCYQAQHNVHVNRNSWL